MNKVLFSIIILLTIAGCSSSSELGDISAGVADKQSMLNLRLEKFAKAMYWTSSNELALYVHEDFQQEFFEALRARVEKEDLVESKVKSVSFYDDSSKASAYIEFRFFNKSTLYVYSKYEKLDWEFFRLNGGWRLRKVESLSEEHFKHLISE